MDKTQIERLGDELHAAWSEARTVAPLSERHPEITRVALYLDNDLAGRVNARKIKTLLKSDQRFSKIRVSVNPPRSGKDYNEKLQRTLQAIREEKHASRHSNHHHAPLAKTLHVIARKNHCRDLKTRSRSHQKPRQRFGQP